MKALSASKVFAASSCILLGVLLIAAGCADQSSPTPPVPSYVPQSVAPVVPMTSPAAQPSSTLVVVEDDDAPKPTITGRPGAYCATKYLGETMTYKGTVYTCKAPKPYRWRK